MSDDRSAQGCAGCESLGDRRRFIQEAAAMAGAALVALGLPERLAASVPFGPIMGRRVGLGEVSYPIPPGNSVEIDKTNEVILVRHAGAVYAFALSCPHQSTALRWEEEAERFQCPKHKSRYQPDGTFISGRATRNMDRLPIRRDGSKVVVDVEKVFESDKDQAGWAKAVVKL